MVKNKIDAAYIISSAVRSHVTTWERARQTERYVINMEPPFDDEKLKDSGTDWMSNWNFGKGRGQALGIITKNASEIRTAISLHDIDFENFDEKKHGGDKVYEFLMIPSMRSDFGERIAAAFSETVIEGTQKIDTIVNRAEYESCLFGYASVVQDESSIFPSVYANSDIAFEDHTDTGDIGRFVTFDVVKGEMLYNILKEIQDSNAEAIKEGKEIEVYGHDEEGCPDFTSSGWNQESLLQVVCDSFNCREDCLKMIEGNEIDEKTKKYNKSFNTWEDVSILAEKNGHNWCSLNTNNVYLAKIHEIEASGVLHVNYCAMSGPVSGSSVDYISTMKHDILFYKKKEKIRQSDVINLIRDITVEGSVFIHDIHGSGKLIGEAALRHDILRNGIYDKATLSGSQWVHAQDGLIEKNTELKVLGGLVVIGRGMEIVPNMLRQDLSGHINLLQIEEQEHSANMQHVEPKTKLSNRPTKDEVNFVNSEALQTRNSDIPQKLKAYTRIITGIFKAMYSGRVISGKEQILVDDFLDTLMKEFSDVSVTKEDLIKILGTVSIVQISPVMSDRQAIQSAIELASTANSRKRLIRMFLSTFGFSRRAIKDIMESEDYGHDAELASIENSMFENTREVVFGLGQDHIIHLQAHFYKIDQKFAGLEAGEDPVRAHLYVTNALTNTAMHVGAVSRSVFYKNKAKDYIKVQKYFEDKLKQLSVELDKQRKAMQQEAEKNQTQNNGEPQLPPEVQAKFYLDKIKLIEKIRTSQLRTQAAQEQRMQSFGLEMELKKQKAAADIENKKLKTKTDVDSTLARKAVEMVS